MAIIRRRHTHKAIPAGRWIVAALDPSPGSHAVMETAFDEALLREASILALTRSPTTASPKAKDHESIRAKLDRYRAEARDDVDIQISTLPISDHISNLLEQSADIDQLVIVGADNPDLVAEVVAPETRKMLRHTDCSILVLRQSALVTGLRTRSLPGLELGHQRFHPTPDVGLVAPVARVGLGHS